MLVLFPLLIITCASAQTPWKSNTVGVVPPEIRQCFYESKWYPVGTVITSGQSMNWCFGRYCDIDGRVKHYDDFNCVGSNQVRQWPGDPTPRSTPPPVTSRPSLEYPTTTTNFFSAFGCWYRGRFFWSGQDIENSRRGSRCLGKYCDWNGKIQTWSDHCRHTMPPVRSFLPDLS